MKNWTVKTQLVSLSSYFLVALVFMGVGALWIFQYEVDRMRSLYEDRVVPLEQLKTVADMYAVNIVDTAHKVRDGAMTAEQGQKAVQEARRVIEAKWTAYVSTYLVEEEKRLIAKIEPMRRSADAKVTQLEGLLQAGDKAAIANYAAHDMYPALDPLQGVVAELIQVQLMVSKQTYEDARENYTKTVYAFAGFSSLVLLVGMAAAFALTRHLTRELGAEPSEVRELADAVSRGELFHHVALKTGDNYSIMASLTRMNHTLHDIVHAVRGNAEHVASASAQVAQGTTDLSTRTEEQAGALQQTAASMDQLNSTVRHNADHAVQANQLAQGASRVAEQGGEVVDQVVSTMRDINDSSKKIADIISVIDGIAFQTNILALNAAVEAARAGDQGRGFAVVASEVRSLAQRSASAAKEIKVLITDSVQRVEQGTHLVDKAGQTMRDVVDSIKRVTDIMTEISTATNEQTSGIEQVSDAVMQMDTVTQQNAALVEESAAAAGSLREQAQSLLQAVAVFKLQS